MFGETVRNARKNAGLTRERVAVECGVSYKLIALIEQGKRAPSARVLDKLILLLDLDIRAAVRAAGQVS